MIAQSVHRLGTDWKVKDSRFDYRQETDIVLVFILSRSDLGSNQPHTNGKRGSVSQELKGQAVKLTHVLHLVERLRMTELPTLFNKSSWPDALLVKPMDNLAHFTFHQTK
jgi:hypothetical protein